MRFLLSDVFLPPAEHLLETPCATAELEGTVVSFSDSGSKSRFFAVVKVVRRQVLIVPVEKLRRVEPSNSQA